MQLLRIRYRATLALLAFVMTSSLAAQSPARSSGDGDQSDVHASARHDFRTVTVAAGLDRPWSIAWLPIVEMLITQRPGRLRIVRNGVLEPDPVFG